MFAVLLTAAFVNADIVIYDNGVGGAAGINTAVQSDFDGSTTNTVQYRGVGFSLSNDSVVTEARWTGLYGNTNTTGAMDDFEIAFYLDDFGLPASTPFLAFDVDAVRVDSGLNLFSNFDIYNYTATFDPVNLAAGTEYYVSIRNRTFGNQDDWFIGVFNSVDSILNNNSYYWFEGSWREDRHNREDIVLYGQAIPEPSLLALSITALLGLSQLRRRN